MAEHQQSCNNNVAELRKAWKDRFIRLEKGSVFYSEDEQSEPKGTFPDNFTSPSSHQVSAGHFTLQGTAVGPVLDGKYPFMFGIVAESRIYYLRTNNENEVHTLHNTCHK